MKFSKLLSSILLCASVWGPCNPCLGADRISERQDVRVVAHQNFNNPCLDGASSLLLGFATLALDGQISFDAVFSTPEPTWDTFKTDNEETAFWFYDCHPQWSSLPSVKPSIKLFDHHASALTGDWKKESPLAESSHADIMAALPSIAGVHMAATAFLKKLCDFLTQNQTNETFLKLKETFEGQSSLNQNRDVFSYLREMRSLINQNHMLDPLPASVQPIFQESVIEIFEATGWIDLTSLGGTPPSVSLDTLFPKGGSAQKAVETIREKLQDVSFVTPQTIQMRLLETKLNTIFKSIFNFQEKTTPVVFSEEALKTSLTKLKNFSFVEETEEALLSDSLKKYELFQLNKMYGLHRVFQEPLFLNKEKVTVIYMPFSPSSGACLKTLSLFITNAQDQKDFQEAVTGGSVREVEPLVKQIIHCVQQPDHHQKVLAIMEGERSISLRANFPMLDFDGHGELQNHLKTLLMNSQAGGHPSAAGCWKRSPELEDYICRNLSRAYDALEPCAKGSSKEKK